MRLIGSSIAIVGGRSASAVGDDLQIDEDDKGGDDVNDSDCSDVNVVMAGIFTVVVMNCDTTSKVTIPTISKYRFRFLWDGVDVAAV